MLSIVAFILLAIGGLAAAAGAIWFIIVAFKEGPLWGIGVMLIPFVSLIFLVKFWSDAWKPFVLQTLGGFVVGIGAAIFIPTMANDMAASAAAFEDSYGEDGYGDEYDEYADDYGEDGYAEDDYADDSYGEDAYGEDGAAVAEGEVEAKDGVSAGDSAGQEPQVADSGLDPTLPAAGDTHRPTASDDASGTSRRQLCSQHRRQLHPHGAGLRPHRQTHQDHQDQRQHRLLPPARGQ